MRARVLLYFLLILLFSFSSIFAADRSFTETNGKSFTFESWVGTGLSPDINAHIPLSQHKAPSSSVGNTFSYSYTPVTGEYGTGLEYSDESEDYAIKSLLMDLGTNTPPPTNFELGPYLPSFGGETHMLSGASVCRIDSLSLSGSSLTINSNLEPYKVLDWDNVGGSWIQTLKALSTSSLSTSERNHFTSLLKKYHYMKVFPYLKVTLADGTEFYQSPVGTPEHYTYNKDNYNDPTGDTTPTQLSNFGHFSAYSSLQGPSGKVPYVLVSPSGDSVPFDISNIQDDIQEMCDDDASKCGPVQFDFFAVPIDGKCDFGKDGILGSSDAIEESLLDVISFSATREPLVIDSFSASPELLGPSGLSTLSWDVSGVYSGSCSLTGPGVSSTGLIETGTEEVSISGNASSFTLTCSDGEGSSVSDTLNVYLDTDLDGVPDNDGTNIDKCPTRAWDEAGATASSSSDFSGCPHLFTHVGGTNTCTGEASFSESSSIMSCDTSGWHHRMDFSLTPTGDVGETLTTSLTSDLSFNLRSNVFEEGFYRCLDHDWSLGASFSVEGTCEVQYNGADQCELLESGTPTGRFIANGFTFTRFSEERFEYGKTFPGLALGIEKEDFTCSFGSPIDVGAFVYDNFRVEPEDYRDIRTTGGVRELDDGRTHSKIKKNDSDDTFFISEKDGSELGVSVPERDPNYEIKVFKNGVNIRNDTIEPEIIALKLHTITRTIRDKERAEEKIENSYNLMTRFDIVKNLTYDPVSDITNVKIHLRGIPDSDQTNLTVYQVIDKDLATDFDSDITFLSDGSGEKIILDKDPVIGWYFNESDDDETVEYEIGGENEGGTIIITQEPILFNEGNIIVNYREGSDSCVFGEASLFEVDNLEHAEVYPVGSGKYFTICVAHTNVSLSEGVGTINQHLFTYDNGGNLSLENNFGNESVDMYATGNSTPIYWDMRIANDNPDGTYSCLGSITNEENSSFGDCGYTNKRIWLHLGEDFTPPTTEVEIPYVAHTIEITLNATDNIGGSGVDETYYCITHEGGTCSDFSLYTGAFTETCPEDWGCTKTMNYYSTDIEGNVEEVKEYTLRIIDRGSACQFDCTAKPSPNRFLKECRNLNGCEYYDIEADEGEAVSVLCDFLTEGSHVKINSTHEVMCPNGPTRPLRFTGFDLSFNNANCKNVISIPFPIFVEGEPVTMRVISCEK